MRVKFFFVTILASFGIAQYGFGQEVVDLPPPGRSTVVELPSLGSSTTEPPLVVYRIPIKGTNQRVQLPGHPDLFFESVKVELRGRRVSFTLVLYQAPGEDKRIRFTVKLMDGDGKYLGGKSRKLETDEGEKKSSRFQFRLSRKVSKDEPLELKMIVHSIEGT